jgi:hypothetical protein
MENTARRWLCEGEAMLECLRLKDRVAKVRQVHGWRIAKVMD